MLNRIIFLGPPACGKGTQSKKLAQHLQLPLLGTGQLLRSAIAAKTPLGLEADVYLKQGLYVPDSLIENLVKEWTATKPSGWILDGYPRTLAQAELMKKTPSMGAPNCVIGMKVPVEILETRIEARRQCKDCDVVTNTFVYSGSSCPAPDCGGTLYARNDDALDNFRMRHQQYRSLTEPLFDYYRSRNTLLEINGNQDPDSVFSQILQHFNSEQCVN